MFQTNGNVEKFMTLLKNKYRMESSKLKNFDDSRIGIYFIKIYAKKHEMAFGNILDGYMILNSYGLIVQKYLREIPDHFSNVFVDEFVVMPDHIHAIIIIDFNGINCSKYQNADTSKLGISTNMSFEKNNKCNSKIRNFQHGPLCVIINQYKHKCKTEICKSHPNFSWQSQFYDHVIQNENELNRIKKYIFDNPVKHSICC